MKKCGISNLPPSVAFMLQLHCCSNYPPINVYILCRYESISISYLSIILFNFYCIIVYYNITVHDCCDAQMCPFAGLIKGFLILIMTQELCQFIHELMLLKLANVNQQMLGHVANVASKHLCCWSQLTLMLLRLGKYAGCILCNYQDCWWLTKQKKRVILNSVTLLAHKHWSWSQLSEFLHKKEKNERLIWDPTHLLIHNHNNVFRKKSFYRLLSSWPLIKP